MWQRDGASWVGRQARCRMQGRRGMMQGRAAGHVAADKTLGGRTSTARHQSAEGRAGGQIWRLRGRGGEDGPGELGCRAPACRSVRQAPALPCPALATSRPRCPPSSADRAPGDRVRRASHRDPAWAPCQTVPAVAHFARGHGCFGAAPLAW